MTVNQNPLKKALSLMSQSPFKTSLPPHFSSGTDNFDLSSSLNHVSQADEFSDIVAFQRKKSTHLEDFHDAVSSGIINNNDGLIGDSLHSELMEDITSTHLKVKLLAEFAISQLPADAHLISFEKLQSLKRQLKQQIEIKTEIESQVQGNAKLIGNFLSKNGEVNTEDLMMLKGLTHSNEQLLVKLTEVNNDIEKRNKAIYSQYLLAMKVSYFEDLDFEDATNFQLNNRGDSRQISYSQANLTNKSQMNGNTTGTRDVQTEQLLSYIVSLVVQRNIPLPVPDDQAVNSQNKWAKDCVDALLEATEFNVTSSNLLSPPVPTSKNNSQLKLEQDYKELKTAMSDLQFAHQFLTRQFEEERTLNNQIVLSHLKKQRSLENKLSENIIILEKSTQKSILVEHEKNILESQLAEKYKEIQSLNKQITDLKLSTLGISSSTSTSTSPSPSSHRDHTYTTMNTTIMSHSTSPITGISINLEPSNDISLSPNKNNPLTPVLAQSHQQNRQSQTVHTPSSSTSHSLPSAGERTSVSIMRNEFKKMYMDLQTQHEESLEREIGERKRLEKVIEEYKLRDRERMI